MDCVLQCVAVCCSLLHCVAGRVEREIRGLCVAVCVAVCCSVLQCVAGRVEREIRGLCVAVCCSACRERFMVGVCLEREEITDA